MIDTNDSEFLSRIESADLKAKICDYVQNVRYEVEQAGIDKRAELEAQLEELRSGKA